MPFIHIGNTFFSVTKDDNLLEVLEREKINIDYQCRNGYCGACRVKVNRGEVNYTKQPLAYTSPNEILPCCCTVKSADLILDMDENVLPQHQDDDDNRLPF